MNTKYGILSVFGAGLATPVYAQEGSPALESKAGEYSVVMVPEGTPLYQVASEFVRGNDNLEDGILKTTLCDDWKVRRNVSNANNDIARLTAKVAGEVGMKDLQKAMNVDDSFVKIEDGSSCTSNPLYITVPGTDGLYGDGFAELKGLSGKVAVVIPVKYTTETPVAAESSEVRVIVGEETPAAETEVTTVVADEGIKIPVVEETPVEAPVIKDETPAPMHTKAPVVEESYDLGSPLSYGNVSGGYHFIYEFAEAPLSGHGLWLEGATRIPLNGTDDALGFDLGHAWFTGLTYSQARENQVQVMDLDMTPLYSKVLGEDMTLTVGANIDARSAAVSYAGIKALTGQWAIGPEVAFAGKLGKFDYGVRASLGWGNVSTKVDIAGYTATEDALTKAKADALVGLDVLPSLWIAGLAGVESDSQDATTQNGGVVPQNETRYTFGGTASLNVAKNTSVDLGLEKILLHTQAGDDTLADTGSVRALIGVTQSW